MNDFRQRLVDALGGEYTIDREVGRGGLAVVFLAEEHKHRRQVALKVLRPDLTAGLLTARFRREIAIAATPPRPFSTSTVASSIGARHSHSTLPAGVCARIARCSMPNAGVVSIVVSPLARRRNLLLCVLRSVSSVVQDWPEAGTNCRSSMQIRHALGGASDD